MLLAFLLRPGIRENTEVPQMNRSRLAEGHLGRDFAVAIADTFAMLFEKFREFGLRYAVV